MIIRVSTEFTRPANATAYSIGDAIGPASGQGLFTLTSIPSRPVAIVGAMLETNGTSPAAANVIVCTSAGYAPGIDNATLSVPGYNDGEVGTVSVVSGTTNALIGGAIFSVDGTNYYPLSYPVTLSGSSVYAAIQTMDVFTPSSGQAFRLSLFVDVQDEAGGRF